MNRSLEEVLETLKNAHDHSHRCSLLIGAGCSVAGGIPTAAGFVDQIKVKYQQAYKRAAEKTHPTNPTYPKCMAELMFAERRALIAEYVDKAKINWAHIGIARLIQSGYVDRVLTTNFDPLIMRACALLDEFPAVYDFASSQLFKSADVADKAIFHLHGQRSGFVIMNTVEECKKYSDLMAPVFDDAGRKRLWIVVGYSGDNDPVFDHLAKVDHFDNGLYWIGYKEQPPSKHLRERLLDADKDAFYVTGHDADSFFVKLTQQLGLFPPDFLQKPFSYLDGLINNLSEFKIPDQESNLDVVSQSRTWIAAARKQFEDGGSPSQKRLRKGDKKIHSGKLDAKATQMLMAGQYEELIKLYERTASPAEKTPSLKEAVAWAYVALGDQLSELSNRPKSKSFDRNFSEAYKKYETALILKPNMHEALYNWGITLSDQAGTKTGDKADRLYAEACDKYKAALAIKPDKHEALINWGTALMDQAKTKSGNEADQLYAQACDKYKAALAIKPDKHEALYNWGNVLLAQAKTKTGAEADRLYAEACDKYKAALAIKPDMQNALNNWGNVLSNQAKTKTGAEADRLYAEACDKYKAALTIKPDNHETISNWGNTLSNQAKSKTGAEADRLFADSYEKYKAALAIKPDMHQVLENWGAALSDQAKTKTGAEVDRLYSESEEKSKKANSINEGSANYNLACLYALQGHELKCKEWLEHCARMRKLPSRSHIDSDQDLASVRDKEWFKLFMKTNFP